MKWCATGWAKGSEDVAKILTDCRSCQTASSEGAISGDRVLRYLQTRMHLRVDAIDLNRPGQEKC